MGEKVNTRPCLVYVLLFSYNFIFEVLNFSPDYKQNLTYFFSFLVVLRPPAGRQYCMPISQQPINRSLPNFQQLLLMSNEGKVESFSSFAYG